MRGLYIHIPFCHQICHYCDFNKVFFKNQPVDEYIEMIGHELQIMVDEGIDFHEVETVFLGGGTPTSLNTKQLNRLLELISTFIPLAQVKEFTTEANPDELTEEKLKVLKNGGVTRLSIGVQTFDNELLKRIGRTHRAEEAIQVVETARSVGFSNVSIDLIYALPEQTLTQWMHTLETALALDLPHYSGYSLIVEPKTVFYNLMNKGKLPLPGEDLEAQMFEILIETMEKQGRRQYEISNFASPDFESLHNLIYWNNEEYLGIGAGAHGYINGKRYANIGPLQKYIETVKEGRRPLFQEHVVTEKEAMEEEMFLGLRKLDGVADAQFQQKFGVSLQSEYGDVIDKLIEQQLITLDNGRYRLTQHGIFRGNDVFQQFLK